MKGTTNAKPSEAMTFTYAHLRFGYTFPSPDWVAHAEFWRRTTHLHSLSPPRCGQEFAEAPLP
eukprot:3198773-Amphidinium_carterae.1